MNIVSSADVCNHFSSTIDMVQREPVRVQEQGRDVAIILSPQEFDRMRRDNIEDFMLFCERMGRKAQAAGMTEEILAGILADRP